MRDTLTDTPTDTLTDTPLQQPRAPGSAGSQLVPKDTKGSQPWGGHGQERCCQESTESIAASPCVSPAAPPARM